VPPDAASACEYDVPTTPLGKVEVVTVTGAGPIVTVSEAVSDPDAESVTRTEKVLLPAALGVPERTPAAERLNPAGSVPLASAQLYGAAPPDAASECE
jgi:hypothetical protein